MSASIIYNQHLAQVPANYAALSPLTFLERAASVFPNRTLRWYTVKCAVHGQKPIAVAAS